MGIFHYFILALLFSATYGDDSSDSSSTDDDSKSKENGYVLEREDCEKGKVQCEDEKTCINENYQCDRFFDCPDRSDETMECGNSCTFSRLVYAGVCGRDDVYCNGTFHVFFSCINKILICDGVNDCGDMEDESTCRECGFGFVPCDGIFARRTCIPLTFVCDGVDDCGTGQDEENCV